MWRIRNTAKTTYFLFRQMGWGREAIQKLSSAEYTFFGRGTLVDESQRLKNIRLVVLYDCAIGDHFVNNIMRLFDVKHDLKRTDKQGYKRDNLNQNEKTHAYIELTDTFEVFIHSFHKRVNKFQNGQFILFLSVNCNDEEERRVSAVNHLQTAVFKERALELSSA